MKGLNRRIVFLFITIFAISFLINGKIILATQGYTGTVEITSPAGGDTVGGIVPVTIIWDDTDKISDVTPRCFYCTYSFYIGSVAIVQSVGYIESFEYEGTHTFSWDTRSLPDTQGTLNVAVCNWAARDTNSITVYNPKGDNQMGHPHDMNTIQGDPVNVINGNMYITKTDLSTHAPGMPFEFTRTYNSIDKSNGPLGAGWTHNFNVVLTPPPDDTSSAIVHGSDGSFVVFYQTTPGNFSPHTGDYSSLTKTGTGYVWERKEKISYSFDLNGRLQSIYDTNNNTSFLIYDEQGRLKTITDTAGRNYVLTYDTNNRITEIADPSGREVTYIYDSNGNLTRVIDPVGNSTEYEYNDTNDQHNITKQTVNGKFVYVYSYNDQDQCISATGLNGELGYNFAYNSNDGNTVITDSKGDVFTKYLTQSGRVVTIAYPDGSAKNFGWDSNLNKTREVDQDNRTWSYRYDARGNVTETSDPLGNQKIITYDNDDNLTSLTDELGRTSNYTYNEQGNVTGITYPDGTNTNFTYNGRGQPLTVADPLGKTTTFSYDTGGNLASVSDPVGNTATYAYDALGRRTGVTDPVGNVSGYEHDALNRITKITDAKNGTINITHDTGGVGSLTDQNNNTTTFQYDSVNQLTGVTDPLGKTRQFAYDANGNLASRTDFNSNTTNYAYNNMDRLTAVTYPDTSQSAFIYDVVGRLTQTTNNTGASAFTYDITGRITTYTDSRGLSVNYTYDATGNLKSLRYPGGNVVNYTYDSLNRLTGITDWSGRQTTYTYDVRGLLTEVALPNGTKTQYDYDDAGRMVGNTHLKGDSSIIAAYSYTLDKNGNITSETGNQPLEPVIEPQVVNYTYGAENRLLSANATTFTYDHNGNMTGKGSTTYQYDYENRLKKVITSGNTWEYEYDGMGNRIGIKSNGNTRRFLLDPTGMTQVLAEYDGAGNVIAYNIYGLGLIYRIDSTGNAYYYHYDFTGNTVAMTDAAGNIVNKYAYTPFGTVVGSEETVSNPFRYVGKYGVIDDNNGLLYMRARYYDPEVGRFITKDPIGFAGGVNLYAIVGNNPIRWVDPSGLKKENVFWDTFWQGVYKDLTERSLPVKLLDVLPFHIPSLFEEMLSKNTWGQRWGVFAKRVGEEIWIDALTTGLGKWHDMKVLGRLPNSLPEMVKHGESLFQEAKSLNSFNNSNFTDFLTFFEVADRVNSN